MTTTHDPTSLPVPVYDEDGITLYQGNCLDILPYLSGVDLVLTDPPYGETALSWDSVCGDWLEHTGRLLMSTGSVWVFGSLRSLLEMDRTGWKLAQDIVWEKHNGSNLLADRFRRVHEHVVQFYPSGRIWSEIYHDPVYTYDATARVVARQSAPGHFNPAGSSAYRTVDGGPRLMRSVIHARSMHGEARHPTEKPLEVLRPLIRYSCPPNGLILDPFAGSGSTLVAARLEGRRAIGIEIDPKYCQVAIDRLRQKALPLWDTAAARR